MMVFQQTLDGTWIAHGRIGGRLRIAEGETRAEAWGNAVELVREIQKEENIANLVVNNVIRSNPNYKWNAAAVV